MNKLTIFFFLFAVFGSIDAFRKVRLGSIPFIELYKGRYTEGITPVPQQYCVEDGAQLCAYYAPDYVKCKNVKYGSGERQTSWRCEAKLANGVRFKMQHVSNFDIKVFVKKKTFSGDQLFLSF